VKVLSSEIFDERGAENFSKYLQLFMMNTKKNDIKIFFPFLLSIEKDQQQKFSGNANINIWGK
jgi:hypothetical protein